MKKAFTLLELLSVLGLMTLLSISAIKLTTYLLNTYKINTEHTSASAQRGLVFELIERDIESAVPDSVNIEENSITFLTFLKNSTNPTPLQYLKKAGNLYRITKNGLKEECLIEGIARFECHAHKQSEASAPAFIDVNIDQKTLKTHIIARQNPLIK